MVAVHTDEGRGRSQTQCCQIVTTGVTRSAWGLVSEEEKGQWNPSGVGTPVLGTAPMACDAWSIELLPGPWRRGSEVEAVPQGDRKAGPGDSAEGSWLPGSCR
ncbi:hypothetical protein NDU88_005812 [Pleurodeles waltl]|uniref:Uncharacterized protein n=1 Tax=Pleurodeles waltl TaxID=8319 RepID=A0AAV7VK31_PLEWA|nr:hypothetical protein NDU88_005812 [Pleurodeles waltl]